MFGQLPYRDSLRDVVLCLSVHREKLYHMGFRTLPKLSTLAKANEKRSWEIYRDLCSVLITEVRYLYTREPALATDIDTACYTIDSTSIDLCLTLFPSLPFVSTAKGAVKLHIGIELRSSIPTFFDSDIHPPKVCPL